VDDELFRPTIETEPAPASAPPWQPDSIAYPAFFGGALAGTVLGLINGRRLGLRIGPLLCIAAAGAAAIAARALATAALDARSGTRLLGSIAGLAVWGVVLAFQKRPFRIYSARDREPASLVWPGIAAAIGCGLLEVLLVAMLVSR
jgi:hypothetical protein